MLVLVVRPFGREVIFEKGLIVIVDCTVSLYYVTVLGAYIQEIEPFSCSLVFYHMPVHGTVTSYSSVYRQKEYPMLALSRWAKWYSNRKISAKYSKLRF
jgi:hypothetical protein